MNSTYYEYENLKINIKFFSIKRTFNNDGICVLSEHSDGFWWK